MDPPARLARACRCAALLTALVLALTATASAHGQPCPGATAVPTAATLAKARRATVCLVNRERRRRHLRALRTNGALQSAASTYAAEMVRGSFFAHVTPSGETFAERVRRSSGYLRGARSWEMGENIAWATGAKATPAQIVASWMRSPGHRRNILHPSFRELGLGIALGSPVRAAAASGAVTYANQFGRRS